MSKAIYTAINNVMKELKAVPKDGKVTFGNKYEYRRVDDVYQAVNPIMAKHGVFNTCTIVDHESTEVKNSNNYSERYVKLHLQYTFYATDGSSITTQAIGEAMDSRDKAYNKAMSAGHKYALQQLFIITGNEDTEQDNTPVPEVKPTSKPKGLIYDNINAMHKAGLANKLRSSKVPESLWSEIAMKLHGKDSSELDTIIKEVSNVKND